MVLRFLVVSNLLALLPISWAGSIGLDRTYDELAADEPADPFDNSPEDSKKRKVLQRLSHSKSAPLLTTANGMGFQGRLSSGASPESRSGKMSQDKDWEATEGRKWIFVKDEAELEAIRETSKLTPIVQSGRSPSETIDEHRELK